MLQEVEEVGCRKGVPLYIWSSEKDPPAAFHPSVPVGQTSKVTNALYSLVGLVRLQSFLLVWWNVCGDPWDGDLQGLLFPRAVRIPIVTLFSR